MTVWQEVREKGICMRVPDLQARGTGRQGKGERPLSENGPHPTPWLPMRSHWGTRVRRGNTTGALSPGWGTSTRKASRDGAESVQAPGESHPGPSDEPSETLSGAGSPGLMNGLKLEKSELSLGRSQCEAYGLVKTGTTEAIILFYYYC